jgi:hypothetical protein
MFDYLFQITLPNKKRIFQVVFMKWYGSDGIISCTEKNEMLNENIEEISQTIQDALEDAILLGVSKECFFKNLATAVGIINEDCNLKT